MSQVMMFSSPATDAMARAAITPAAGPDSAVPNGIALGDVDRHDAAVRLHDQHITIEGAAGQPVLQPVEIRRDHRLQIGIERRCGESLEFANFRQDLSRRSDIRVGPNAAYGLSRDPLVRVVGVAVL